MDVLSLISAHELLHHAKEHMSTCNIADTVEDIENKMLCAMCEEMQGTCRSVWEVLNKILDENEEGKSEDSGESFPCRLVMCTFASHLLFLPL